MARTTGSDVDGARSCTSGRAPSRRMCVSFAVTPPRVGRSPASPADRLALITALEHEALRHRRHDAAVHHGAHPPSPR